MKKRKKLLISIFSIFAFVLSIFSFNLFKNVNAMSIDSSISSTIDDITIINSDNPRYNLTSTGLHISCDFDYNDYSSGLSSFEPYLQLHTINPIVSSVEHDFVIVSFQLNYGFGYYNSNDETIFSQNYSSWYLYSSDNNGNESDYFYGTETFKPMFIVDYGDNINTYSTSVFSIIYSSVNSSDFYIHFYFVDDVSYTNFSWFFVDIFNIEVYTYSNSFNRSQFDNSTETFYNEGYNVGYSSGYNNGYDLGNNNGYNNGYSSGYNVGVNEYKSLYDNLVVQYNDLQDLYNDYLDGNVSFNTLVWNIATIPFESFKQIWNVDLLGLNIGNFVTALMFVGVVVFIWKKFL